MCSYKSNIYESVLHFIENEATNLYQNSKIFLKLIKVAFNKTEEFDLTLYIFILCF